METIYIKGRGGLKRIGEAKQPCISPEHNPPMHIVLPAGIYEYTCPSCGEKQTFEVQEVVW